MKTAALILLFMVALGCASTNDDWTVERKNFADRANALGRAARAHGADPSQPPVIANTREPLLCDTNFIGYAAYTGCY